MQPMYKSTILNLPRKDNDSRYVGSKNVKDPKASSSNYDKCDIEKDNEKEKDVTYKNSATITNVDINNDDVSKTTSISIIPVDSTLFVYSTNEQSNCDATDMHQVSNRCKQNTCTKSCGKSKNSKRRGNKNPPPRPPRQKQPTTLPLAMTKKHGSADQTNTMLNEGCMDKEANKYLPSLSTKNSVMSPLSSCPNIYGNVVKKQINFKHAPDEDVSKSISLVASDLHLCEEKGQKELLPNLKRKGNLDDIITPCMLKPMVTAVAQSTVQRYYPDELNFSHKTVNDEISNAFDPSQTCIGMETFSCASKTRPSKQTISMHGSSSNNKNEGSLPFCQDQPQTTSKYQNSMQDIIVDRPNHLPSNISNHEKHQNTKNQIDHNRHNDNFFSTSPSSSINSVIYKKCKLCDKCSQRYGHSNKAVGTRGETTLI